MPKKDTSDGQEKSGNKAKPTKKKTMLVILISLVVLAGSSAGAYFYFNKPAGEAAQAKTAKTVELETLDMGDMVVNLAGNGGGHYLRVKITLEYPKDKKLPDELKKKKPQVSDVLITTLRSKTLAEISSVGSIQGLKQDLLKEINSQLESGEVTGIYFTDFLVQ